MRKIFVFIIALFFSQHSVSQTVNDVTTFLGSELNGSARFNSMAGAFGALGGDLSAISHNPAGSSVFLHSEIGGTFTYNQKVAEGALLWKFKGNSRRGFDIWNLDQIGGVFVFNNNDAESPWSRISTGINSHRVLSV